ncbi:hypothetical protein NDU88_006134 [Pleurodeles waltl]|uniref:Uncharacterized protein n=1 Tax=Pleurodeles waltl TaxID=8319 RepID=A0AAV7SNR0_PLEWA|nr:hypothetical protein NDU88_006134 [Pleurodeles waltl]
MPRTATRWRHMRMPFFPEKKRKYRSTVEQITLAASRERDAWCTAGADKSGPGGKTIEDKSPERQREVERLSDPRRRAAPEANLGHRATRRGEVGRSTMRESAEGTSALEKNGVWKQVGTPSPRKLGSVFWGKLETAH